WTAASRGDASRSLSDSSICAGESYSPGREESRASEVTKPRLRPRATSAWRASPDEGGRGSSEARPTTAPSGSLSGTVKRASPLMCGQCLRKIGAVTCLRLGDKRTGDPASTSPLACHRGEDGDRRQLGVVEVRPDQAGWAVFSPGSGADHFIRRHDDIEAE